MKSSAALQLSLLPDPTLEAPQPKKQLDGRLGVTFRDSKALPVHRWYPYVEGFSADYLREHLGQDDRKSASVYDPFGGSGTVNLEASKLGVASCFSEVNPFMRFVAETKVNARFKARRSKEFAHAVDAFRKYLQSEKFAKDAAAVSLQSYREAFAGRDFFVEGDLQQLIAARNYVTKRCDVTYVRDLLLLAIASVIVSSSHMTRRADLRRRRENEYVGRVVDVPAFVLRKLEQIERDVATSPGTSVTTHFFNADAREFDTRRAGEFSLILTSPPYVNGTNYIRNTKLELWFLNFIKSEKELAGLNKQSIVCGINNVTKSRLPSRRFDFVEEVAGRLDAVSPDDRIPALVRGYCSDMAEVLLNCRKYLRPDGRMVLDIGDSQFYGVHVPTDVFLCRIAEEVGFDIEDQITLARRHSHDKTPLRQVELVLRPRHQRKLNTVSLSSATQSNLISKSSIAEFERVLPHTAAPYTKRNWGHPLHSLCSYQGKLKPSLAHWLVHNFTSKGDLVVDPLGGVGTIAFEAALQGRRSVSSDLSPFPSVVAAGKLASPDKQALVSALDKFEKEMKSVRVSKSDFEEAEFGLNATAREYYHPETLREVLAARKLFQKNCRRSKADTFIFACLLHILHGNRPYALSRCSHPITPFSPTGKTEYRPLLHKLRERCVRIIDDALPTEFVAGTGLNLDFRKLKSQIEAPADVVISSPPFPGMRFDRPNWLRLWFCGWKASDFHETSRAFLERQQTESIEVYREFFAACAALLRPGGNVILHVGGSKSYNMVESLKRLGQEQFSLVGTVAEDVRRVEKHGIRDKGLTDEHHLLFFKLSE